MHAKKTSKVKSVVKKESFFTDRKKIALVLIGAFLIILMVGSALVQWNEEDSEQEYEYNGFTLIQIEGYWKLIYGEYSFAFNYDPKSLENISIENFDLDKEKVYLGYVPENESLADQSVQRVSTLLKYIVPTVTNACLIEKGCPDIPVVSCNGNDTVVWLKKSSKDKIFMQDNCLVLGYNSESVKIVDLFMYRLLGVM